MKYSLLPQKKRSGALEGTHFAGMKAQGLNPSGEYVPLPRRQ
jgi:hypothetical protein